MNLKRRAKYASMIFIRQVYMKKLFMILTALVALTSLFTGCQDSEKSEPDSPYEVPPDSPVNHPVVSPEEVNLPQKILFTSCTTDCAAENFTLADGEWTVTVDKLINHFTNFGFKKTVMNADSENNAYSIKNGSAYAYFSVSDYARYDDKMEVFMRDLDFHGAVYSACTEKDGDLIAVLGDLSSAKLKEMQDFLNINDLKTWPNWNLKTNATGTKYKMTFGNSMTDMYYVYFCKKGSEAE